MNLAELQREVHETSRSKGWYDDAGGWDSVPTKLALMHSEISEALEEFRNGNMALYYDIEGKKPQGFGIELADAIIRILDSAEYLGLNMEDYVQIKKEYNKTRPYRHGGKKI